MIRTLEIEGFKCFKNVKLDFGNLTLLSGKNSRGKSTVIQAILAMFQNGDNPFCGRYINLGKIDELKNRYFDSPEVLIRVNSEYEKRIIDEHKPIVTKGDLAEKINIRYISADRVGVKNSYEMVYDCYDEIGVRCEFAYQYLSLHSADRFTNDKFVYDRNSKLTYGGQVNYWLEKILGYIVKAEEIPETDFIKVTYGNDALGFNIRPQNIGTGVSYMAEIIIAALTCDSGDLLIIENPEIHLHPSGQAEFIEFLCFLASNGIQVIIETHSDHIYNGIRKAVVSDMIDCHEIKVYFFDQKEKYDYSPVFIQINEDGKAMTHVDGLFDQIDKDLDVILGW